MRLSIEELFVAVDILLHISRQILFFYFVTNGRASCRKKILGPVPNISAKEIDSKEIIKVSLRQRWEALDREPQSFMLWQMMAYLLRANQ